MTFQHSIWASLYSLCAFVILLTNSLSAQEKYPESNSIVELTKGEPEIILARRSSGGKIRGELVSFTADHIQIRVNSQSKQATTFSWIEFELVFAEGLTNAAELLEAAHAETEKIENILANLSFSVDQNDRASDLVTMRNKALQLAKRLKSDIRGRVPELQILPTISAVDRAALHEVEDFLDIFESNTETSKYTPLLIKNRFDTEVEKHAKVQKIWSGLKTFEKHLAASAFNESGLELEFQMNRLSSAGLTTEEESILNAMQEVGKILDLLLDADSEPTRVEVSRLANLKDSWGMAEQALAAGSKIKALGPVTQGTLQRLHADFITKMNGLDVLMEEIPAIIRLSTALDGIDHQAAPELLQRSRELDLLRTEVLDERALWNAREASSVQKYAIQQLARLDSRIHLLQVQTSIEDSQRLTAQFSNDIKSVRSPAEARRIAISVEDLSKQLQLILSSVTVTQEIKNQARMSLNKTKEVRLVALETELKLHRHSVEVMQNSWQSFVTKPDTAPNSVLQLIQTENDSLVETLKFIKEIAEDSPSTQFEVNTVTNLIDQLQDFFQLSKELESIRDKVQSLNKNLAQAEDLKEIQKTLDSQITLLAKLDLSEAAELQSLQSWTRQDIERLQARISKAQPIISFHRESLRLQELLTTLSKNLADQPLSHSKIAEFEASQRMELISGWLKSNPELQVDQNQQLLLQLQSQRKLVQEEISQRIRQERLDHGWLPLEVNGEIILIAPEPENATLLALSAINETDAIRAEQFLQKSTSQLEIKSQVTGPEEISARLRLREANQAERNGDLQQAHALYDKLAAGRRRTRLTEAAQSGLRRTTARIAEVLSVENSQRQYVAIGLCLFAFSLIIGSVIVLQFKSVKMWRARRLVIQSEWEFRNGNSERAESLLQRAGELLAKELDVDPDLSAFFSGENSPRPIRHQLSRSSSLKLPVSQLGQEVKWMTMNMHATERTIVDLIDEFASSGQSLNKKDRQKLFNWLTQELNESHSCEESASSWKCRELARIVKLFPVYLEFRVLLGHHLLSCGEYTKTIELMQPILESENRIAPSIRKEASELIRNCYLALEEWREFDRLNSPGEQRTKKMEVNKARDLSILARRMHTENSSNLNLSDIGKSIDRLLK